MQVQGGHVSNILISEELASALINLINVGRFPFEYREIKQVEMELFKAIENANIEVTYTNDKEDATRAVLALVKEEGSMEAADGH